MAYFHGIQITEISGMAGSIPSVPSVLGGLTLSGQLRIGVPTSGTINSATAGSAIVSLIPGITVDSATRVYAGTPTGAAGVIVSGLVETLAGAANSPNATAITILAALPTVTLSADLSLPEGNSGPKLFTFTVTRSASAGAVSVPYGFTAGTTVAADYTGGIMPAGGTVALADGVATGTFTISVNGDTDVEPDEGFAVSLTAPAGYALGVKSSATGTILNDDTTPLPTVSLSADLSLPEGNSGPKLFTFTITRSSASGAVSVAYGFAAGATDATDYTGGTLPTGGTVAMANGVLSGTFSISINGDATVEPDEAFTVSLTAPGGYALGAKSTATGTILNDDSSGTNASVSEFAPVGATAYSFSDGISRSKVSGDPAIGAAGTSLRLEAPPGAVGSTKSAVFRRSDNNALETVNLTVAEFLPWEEGSCLFWVDGESGVTMDGTNKVTRWASRVPGSGGFDFASGAEPAWVANQANGRPWLDFTGSKRGAGDVAAIAAVQALFAANLLPWSIVVVTRPSANAATKQPFSINKAAVATSEVLSPRVNSGQTTWEVLRGDANNNGASTKPATPPTVLPALNAVQVQVFRSDGFMLDNIVNGSSSSTISDNPASNGAHVGGSATIAGFGVGANAAGANFFNDPILAIGVFSKIVGPDAMARWANKAYGAPLNSDLGALLDLSNFTLIDNSEFDNPSAIYHPTIATDWQEGGTALPRPVYAPQLRNQYGGKGALDDEIANMMEPRDPLVAPYGLYSVADGSALRLRAQAKPSPSTVPELWTSPITHSQMTGSLIALNKNASETGKPSAIQYGYWEFRMKCPPGQPGVFPAAWLMNDDGAQYDEIDVMEQFGTELTFNQGILTNDRGQMSSLGRQIEGSANISTRSLSRDYNLFGTLKTPDGIYAYFNRRLVGKARYGGAKSATVTAGGSGYTSAPTVVVTATLGRGGRLPAFTATVSGGAVTGVTMTTSGSRVVSATLAFTGGGGGTGATATVNLATLDPGISPSAHNAAHYWLINNAIRSGGFAGAADVSRGPWDALFDYVRVYEMNFPTPALGGGTDPDAQSYFTEQAGAGAALSTRQQTAINNFVKRLKNQWRFDTTPLEGVAAEWDVTKVSMWDGIAALPLFMLDMPGQALRDLRVPSRLWTANGAPVFVPGAGFRFTGVAGQYLGSGLNVAGSNLIRPVDHTFGIAIGEAAANSALATAIGIPTNNRVMISSTGMDALQAGSSPAASTGTTLPKGAPGTSLLTASRGYQAATRCYRDGYRSFTGYIAGYPNTAMTGELRIGAHDTTTAGATFLAQMGFAARLMPPLEQRKFAEAWAELKAALA